MAATETAERQRLHASPSKARRMSIGDETKNAFKTTEFFAMVGIIGAILIAAAVSDSFGDRRAWTLVAAVAIGYMISRGLAKSGTKYGPSSFAPSSRPKSAATTPCRPLSSEHEARSAGRCSRTGAAGIARR
jgi:hypothetical protein